MPRITNYEKIALANGAGDQGTASSPVFSIITVCRNAEATVGVALQSLANQTFADWEWIMVDGASTDATVARADLLKGKGRHQLIISEPDSGIYNAMNKGLRAARGRYVYFLNTDDSYCDDRVLEGVAAELQRLPDTDFLYGNIIVQSTGRPDVLVRPPPPERALQEMVCGCLPHQGSFARTSLFSGEIGFFDDNLRTAADYQWMMRVISKPIVRLHYFDREIARYSADGSSSKLEQSLPESFKVLNENIEFQQAIGVPNIIDAYQRQILVLRVQLRDLLVIHEREKEKYEREKEKYEREKQKYEREKEKFARLTAKQQEQRAKLDAKKQTERKSWLPRWLRF